MSQLSSLPDGLDGPMGPDLSYLKNLAQNLSQRGFNP
jgi:hypothetical protein